MTPDKALSELIGQIKVELENERMATLTPKQRELHRVAQNLLLLERDLTAPGAALPTDSRVDRLLEAIAKERF